MRNFGFVLVFIQSQAFNLHIIIAYLYFISVANMAFRLENFPFTITFVTSRNELYERIMELAQIIAFSQIFYYSNWATMI